MVSALFAIAVSLAVGGVIWYFTHRQDSEYKISTNEFLIGATISTLVLLIAAPLVEWAIINDRLKYVEYFNGVEVQAVDQRVVCERDGDCTHSYACDPYLDTEIYFDDEGDIQTRVTLKHHSCPYLKVEHRYSIATTLGNYDMEGVYAEPDRARWRGDQTVPASIPTGPPRFWAEAKARIDSGKPGGVTKAHAYKNFLLASDKTILDAYSADIERYLKEGLLPDHTVNFRDPIYNYYLAEKFIPIRLDTDTKAWNEALMRLNGHLGNEKQGDIHLAAIDANLVKDQDRYAQSLFAHWKSDTAFGKYALPKNAVAIVVGVKDGTIVWARATGGLPVGNEGLFDDIRNQLAGVAFSPEAVIGIPKLSPGILTSAMWGEHSFKRPCMECVEEGTNGYAYLKSDIYITAWQRFWIVFVAVLLSAGMWAMFLVADDRVRRYYRGY